ncbi:MAG: PDZ domain-containing protein [Polyangiales bacterium]
MRSAVFLATLLAACNGYDDLALLEVDEIEPAEVEAGGTLLVHGRGFPLGRIPEIALRGSAYRPGQPVRAVDVPLNGSVQSDSLIEVPIGDELMEALGGRATVDGELRVGFRTADDHRDIFSAERVRLDFLPDTSALLRAKGAGEPRSGLPDAEGFGLELSHEELGTVGVRVLSVEPDGLAATQGVKPDDTLVGLDGMNLYSRRDFLPDPSKHESTVLVARQGLRGVHALRWPHEATQRSLDPIGLAVLGLLGLLLGALSPAALCVRAVPPPFLASAWLLRSSLVLIFAVLLLWAPALQWTSMWILGLGTFAALGALAGRHRGGVIGFAYAVVATLTVMLLARSASISAIVSAQGPAVLHWYLFQSPASLLALGAYLHGLDAASSRPGVSASPYCAAAAVLGASLFLGGCPLVGSVASIATLVAKAAAIMVAARVFEMSPRAAVTCSGLGLGLAILGLLVDLGDLFPQWSAVAVGIVSAIVVRSLVPKLRRESVAALV